MNGKHEKMAKRDEEEIFQLQSEDKSNQETEEFVEAIEEPVNESETETANGQEVTKTPQQQIDLTMGTSGATQSQRDLPTPANGKPASSCDSLNRCSNCNGTNNVANLETTVQSILTTVEYIRTSLDEVKSTVARLEQNALKAPGSKTWPEFDPDRERFTGKKFDDSEGVHVYTDGSCKKNGKNGARAGIGVYWGDKDPLNISERLPGRPTNNRAEIHAAIRAVQQAKKKGIQNLIICSDSQYLIECITDWINGWKKNGWVKARGGPVKNKEDLMELDKELKGINVKWLFVPGHAGDPGNKAADSLSRQGAEKNL